MQVNDRVARRESPGDVSQVVPFAPLDADTRAMAVDMVRRSIGSSLQREVCHYVPSLGRLRYMASDPAAMYRAVRSCADMLKHPADTQARAAHLSIPSDGTMAPLPAAPDAWSARNHKSRVTRSKKRGASFKVDRVGMSPVIGDRYNVTAPYDVDAVDALSLIERVAVSRDLVALAAHRLVCGAVGLDVQLVTDKHYRGHGLEPLVGTEVGKSYTVALSRQIDRSDVPHAAGSKGLSGWAHLSDLDEIAAPVTAFKVNVKKHGARLKVPALTLRDSEAPAERLFICHPRDGITSYTALTAPSHDYAAGYWRGHTFTPRGASAHHGSRQVRETETVQVPFTLPAVHRGRWNASATRWDAVAVMPERVVFKLKTVNVTKSVTAARTVNTAGELVECETPAGVATAAECLNRGERVVLSVCGVKVTVTRGKGKAGTYAVNAGKERGKVGGLRTVDSVAVHALKLSA